MTPLWFPFYGRNCTSYEPYIDIKRGAVGVLQGLVYFLPFLIKFEEVHSSSSSFKGNCDSVNTHLMTDQRRIPDRGFSAGYKLRYEN